MMSPLEQVVFNFLEKLNLLAHQTILVGLSGGPDSVALLDLLNKYKHLFKYKLIAAHLDHQWRKDSYQDVLFCQSLCQKLNIELICKKLSDLPELKSIRPNGSKEAFARDLRRAFFVNVAQSYQAQHIALAHHLDDQIETFFIRLIRGSSLSGLGIMQAQNGYYIRPLLTISKSEILGYLNHNRLNYMTDHTNNSNIFLRNKIRKLLPKITDLDPRFKQNFVKTVYKIQETSQFITKLAQIELSNALVNNQLNLKSLWALDPFLQNEVILQWLYQNQVKFVQTSKFVDEILRFFKSPHGGVHQITDQWHIVKKQNQAQINFL